MKLVKKITETFAGVTTVLSFFTKEDYNKIPFEGSWTAGQVAEHMIKSLTGASGLLHGPTQSTKRDPQEKVKSIKDLFLDYTIKMKSPGFILPTELAHDTQESLQAFHQLEKELLASADLDLSLTCLANELPTFGFLTRTEWIEFFLAHTQRHTQQLKNILQRFNDKKNVAIRL